MSPSAPSCRSSPDGDTDAAPLDVGIDHSHDRGASVSFRGHGAATFEFQAGRSLQLPKFVTEPETVRFENDRH